MMTKEIDLRSLIAGNLKCEKLDIIPIALADMRNDNLVERNFKASKIWNRTEQTSYIESIFLRCGLQPIIRFKNFERTIIVDGYNRYLSVKNFCENKLILDGKGLKQLKFLANKSFDDLSSVEKTYFMKSDPITVWDYSYDNSNTGKILNEKEEYEIIRYLHLIYNTGLRLEIEEIQKAQFYDDYLTNKIKNKINSEEEFLNMLMDMGLFNGRKKRNMVDNILLNCRLLIASTYSNMNSFCSTYNIETRIEKNYIPNLKNINLDVVYNDFLLNIKHIHKNLINTQIWNKYSLLHTKPFLEATYWLISVIRKDNLGDPLKFDFSKYLEYFGEIENTVRNFNIYQAHYKKNIYNKYFVVAKYYEEFYGVDMSHYFNDELSEQIDISPIKNIDELYKNHFNFKSIELRVNDLLQLLQGSNYNLRPYYQRLEVMSPAVSSKIIESLLLGIRIPFILACDVHNDNNIITEIIDGQQRILSLLAYLKRPFMNEEGMLELSQKNGYSLSDLRILYELNDLKFGKYGDKNVISEKNINKIYNSPIYIYKSVETKNDNFSAVDHFVRLNKNNYTIKEHTYRMWSLFADREILEYEENITNGFACEILPKINYKFTSHMITFKLAVLFYNKSFDDINLCNYSNRKVSSWFKEFNMMKDKYMFSEQEKIDVIRKKYIDALDEVKYFYDKINEFLKVLDKNIRDLVVVNGTVNIPVSNYYYLFCMLGNFSQAELMVNAKEVYNIIRDFFEKIKNDKLENKEIIELLRFKVKELCIFDSNRRFTAEDKNKKEFEKKLRNMLDI